MELYNLEEHGFINLNGNWIHSTAIIYPCVTLGRNNIIGAYSVIGSNGEMRNVNPSEFKGGVVIGDDNVISELVTIQRPFNEDEFTLIGNGNIIMAHSHFGHNVTLGNNSEICTNVVLGGYSNIGDNVKIKLSATVRNRIIIGSNSIAGLGSAVVKDIPGGQVWMGNPAKFYKLNNPNS